MANSTRRHRRKFLCDAGKAAIAWGSAPLICGLPAVSFADAKGVSSRVQFRDDIEPLVRLIEETPRQQLLERVAQRIKSGTSYQEVLAALLCAGVRNVQPRPSVGFKFHTVLVVNSCHLASLQGPDQDRWLPIFWALDYFKSSQADEKNRSGWTMQPVDESKVPSPEKARASFIEAMEKWDEDQADVATAALVRSLPANEVFDLFARYAGRDYRSIGHKAIFLANAWRTLQVIGFNNAEPILRSLAFALLNHEGEGNPASHDHAADRPWRRNAVLLGRIPANWKSGQIDSEATRELINSNRGQSAVDVGASGVDMLSKGISPTSIWDGVFLSAAELLMQQPGIIGLHGLTTANAMHYIYRTVGDEDLQKRLLLQACSFVPMFRSSAQGRGALGEVTFHSWSEDQREFSGSVADLVTRISDDKMSASREIRTFLANGGDPYKFIDEARRQIFLRGQNAHDYKYSSAVLEDFDFVSPAWRNDFLALSVFNLKGARDRQSNLIDRTRSALS